VFKLKSFALGKSIPIAKKLPLALLGSALLVSLGVGVASITIGSQAVGTLAERNLNTLASERANQLDVFMKTVEANLVATSQDATAIQAMRDFSNAWFQMKDTATQTLQQTYITDNTNPPDKRLLLIEDRCLAHETTGVGQRCKVVVVISEDRRRIASIGGTDAARNVGRLRAFEEQKIGGRGLVFETFRRGIGAELDVNGAKTIVLDEGAGDRRGFDARAAEIIDEFVGPILEQRAAGAETGAAEIVAAGEIGVRGRFALAVIGRVVLHERAQRNAEIAVAKGERRAAVLQRNLHVVGALRLKIGILCAGAALEIGDGGLRIGLFGFLCFIGGTLLFQILNLGVQLLHLLLQRVELCIAVLRGGLCAWREGQCRDARKQCGAQSIQTNCHSLHPSMKIRVRWPLSAQPLKSRS